MSEPARSIAHRPQGVRFADGRYSEQTSVRAERGDRSNLFCRLCPAARGHRGRGPYPIPGVPMQQAYAYAIPPNPHPTPRPPRTPGEKIGRTFFVGYRSARGKSTSLPRTPSLWSLRGFLSATALPASLLAPSPLPQEAVVGGGESDVTLQSSCAHPVP